MGSGIGWQRRAARGPFAPSSLCVRCFVGLWASIDLPLIFIPDAGKVFWGDLGGTDFIKLGGLCETIFIIFDTLMDLHTRGDYLLWL